ncbi:hypothetical protein [Rhodopila sp.]|uniref:hypothetical protein n=1 Tax=Rhodopila sp. TaxID=2480087 RepID=UPI003D1428ED
MISKTDGSFDVQMAKPSGQPKTATGFGSEHEANAWIVQAKRMKRDAAPWTPLVPRKPGATTTPKDMSTDVASMARLPKP